MSDHQPNRIKIRSTVAEGVSIEVNGQDITDMVLADPAPVVHIASGTELGSSRVHLTLGGDVEIETDGSLVQR